MAFIIVKEVSGVLGEQILIYPSRNGDEIYSYSTLIEAQQKVNEIKNYPIYSDCVLQIIEDTSWNLI
jgi:hypothetical protein